MTRQFNQRINCQNCGKPTTVESAFGRWIRGEPSLDSGNGICVVDQDYWIHRFKTHGYRGVQCLMLVEIKTRNGKVTNAQRDTLHIANQLMRNRRQTPTKNAKFQALEGAYSVYSLMMNC